jgi:hypothetical protein
MEDPGKLEVFGGSMPKGCLRRDCSLTVRSVPSTTLAVLVSRCRLLLEAEIPGLGILPNVFSSPRPSFCSYPSMKSACLLTTDSHPTLMTASPEDTASEFKSTIFPEFLRLEL